VRLLNASGCLDALAAPDVARQLDVFVTKTVTPLPRDGNPPVRIADVGVGMLNSIGLANPGIERFLADVLPRLRDVGVPIWVSVGGFSAGDYACSCELLDECQEVEAIELNVSCPNVDPSAHGVGEVVAAARRATSKPLYAKLSPAVPDVAALAVVAEDAGADGLSLVNTIRGAAIDARSLHPTLGTMTGGLSGPALKPIALAAVLTCAAATSLPIVGMGGVASGRDALDFLAAGATDVAVGTALFSDPSAPPRIRAELAALAPELARVREPQVALECWLP
jgi:dihydroorotate dehydrogenase (NAD+) catalytic subunit